MPVGPEYAAAPVHATLPDSLYAPVLPARFPEHRLRYFNAEAASTVGLDTLSESEVQSHFAGFAPLPDNLPQPLALAYHGHQFQMYNPDLGDGRGFLYAQVRESHTGRLLDLGTKGSGRTPWSRGGDGRLTLKGGVRELLASALLDARGVDTSRTFCIVETGEALVRNDEPSPTRSCVLTRLSHSHVRIGTFQRVAFLDDRPALAALVDHVAEHLLPEAQRAHLPDRAVALVEAACTRVARVGAQWLAAGFVHGVLNSDNINITGESFDYGPWRFLPTLDPGFTAAYFDSGGLYAFGRQPDALLWNLTRLAECMLPLATRERLERALEAFEPALHHHFVERVLARLGVTGGGADDEALAVALWRCLRESRLPFERVFHDWHGGPAALERALDGPLGREYRSAQFQPLRDLFERFEPTSAAAQAQHALAHAAPPTLLIDDVESLWTSIAEGDDWTGLEQTLEAIERYRDIVTGHDTELHLLT